MQVHVVHLESIWSPGKLQVDFGKYLAGPSANENPHGLHLESMGKGKVLATSTTSTTPLVDHAPSTPSHLDSSPIDSPTLTIGTSYIDSSPVDGLTLSGFICVLSKVLLKPSGVFYLKYY